MYGFNGKILRVDLSKHEYTVVEPVADFYRKYLGGRNFGLYFLLKETEPGFEPLGPDNILVFSTGPATGAPLAGFSRHSVVAKSPLTGGFGEAEAGGFFAPELRFAGFDAIVIKGTSPNPVYLWIQDGKTEIRDASNIWGLKTKETQEAIREEAGDPLVRIALIGPAGENQVKYACIINELHYVNGRSGLGAVMGSKKLKAIAVRGHGKPQYKSPQKIRGFAKWFSENWKKNSSTVFRSKYGTAGSVLPLNQDGLLPTRNFIKGTFEYAEQISGEKIHDTILVNTHGCYACPIRCKLSVKAENPYETDPIYGGPEYETIGAFGSLCEVDNINAISYANQQCNAYGLDTISTGCCIAFAMECIEENILTTKETNGLNIRFGNADAMVKLVEMIAYRKGIGDLLAEGVRKAAEKIGKNAEQFAIHVKGKELPMHEPRGKPGVGVEYALSASGADHMQAAHDPAFKTSVEKVNPLGILEPVDRLSLGDEKVRLVKYLERWWLLLDILDVCKFTILPHGCGVFTINQIPEIINAATGWDTSLQELLLAADRSINMARLFNQREGLTEKEDTLPARFFKPLQTGPRKGSKIKENQLKKAVKKYYQISGWTPQGKPEKTTLHKLYLDEFIET
jgi:aldehyde:ferredoxin oxidoreductase